MPGLFRRERFVIDPFRLTGTNKLCHPQRALLFSYSLFLLAKMARQIHSEFHAVHSLNCTEYYSLKILEPKLSSAF